MRKRYGSAIGAVMSLLLVVSVIGLGVWLFIHNRDVAQKSEQERQEAKEATLAKAKADAVANAPKLNLKEIITAADKIPILSAPVPYEPKDNIVEVELSEYPGYSGLIVANGGMHPNKESVFYKQFGFQVKLSLSEEESWSKLNSGKMGASATTVDVLAAYGKQFEVVVPAQIGYSRGADGIVVRDDIKRINDLKGRVLSCSQFTESDFFIRYLADEAGVKVAMTSDLQAPHDPDKINLVYCTDGQAAGDLFMRDVAVGTNLLSGTVTWSPKTDEVVDGTKGKAHLLTSNRNLLVIADVLIVNKGFANKYPKMVEGLTHGLLEGNSAIRQDSKKYLPLIASAFKWDVAKAEAQLKQVHLSNLRENIAFFNGEIDAAGSFAGIYNWANLSYGPALIGQPGSWNRFFDNRFLSLAEASGDFANQQIEIKPIRTASGVGVENNPLLSKNIKFFFPPNITDLDLKNADNLGNLESVKKLLQVSPGSTIMLRGHMDDAKVADFKEQGEDVFRQMRAKAIADSEKRAKSVQSFLANQGKIDPTRIEAIGRGWEEPVVPNNKTMSKGESEAASEKNRRVEVQWFTIE